MADAFGDFLRRPSAESYLALRREILDDPGFDMFADSLRRFEAFVDSGAATEALAMVPELMPNWLLSPRAHAAIARAAAEAGDATRARAEMRVAEACLYGLTQTGTGAPEAPYAALHVADQGSVLRARGRVGRSQRTEVAEGRFCDVLTDTTGAEHWFDMTDSIACMSARLTGAAADGQ